MKISIKEAYEMARKALPSGGGTKIEVHYGSTSSYRSNDEKQKISWEIQYRGENSELALESDEYFSVALAKLVAEINRSKSKPVDDVVAETDENPQAEPGPTEPEAPRSF